jgi:hypothetical protein
MGASRSASNGATHADWQLILSAVQCNGFNRVESRLNVLSLIDLVAIASITDDCSRDL